MWYAKGKHYRNPDLPGNVFFTTTVLDFVRVFDRLELRTEMALSLLEDHAHYTVPLHAFVVMPHHIHYLSTVPVERSGPWLMSRIKSNSARRLLVLLSDFERAQFDQQRGLNRRTLWQASYRSVAIANQRMFAQKVRYIHENPVRAGLCCTPEEYRWSSALAHRSGLWDSENGLDALSVLESIRGR